MHSVKNNSLCHLYIELEESNPVIWRRIVVPVHYTFYQLHMAVQGAFGWENAHLFQFSEKSFLDKVAYGILYEGVDTGDTVIKDAKKERIVKLLKKAGDTCLYVYDFGDGWQHRITLEKLVAGDLDGPWCLEGSGACPPEDVGGMDGYQKMVEILKTPAHPEQEEYIQWLGLKPGEIWNADFCSVRETNKRLALLTELL